MCLFVCVCVFDISERVSLFLPCSKADIMNLLESAGFSRSNPYYIVKQGKVCICVYIYRIILTLVEYSIQFKFLYLPNG